MYELYVGALIEFIEQSGYEALLDTMFDDAFKNLQFFKDKLIKNKVLALMPLYVAIEECDKQNFFLDSQYILPSNYDDIERRAEKMTKRLIELERIKYYIIPKNIKDSLKGAFKTEVKDHQYSVITIIGLYASFITFVLANVNILPHLIQHSIGAVLAFMLVLGVVLFFFVATLKILFSSEKHFYFFDWKVSYVFLWLIIAVLITGFAMKAVDDYGQKAIYDNEKTDATKTDTDTNKVKPSAVVSSSATFLTPAPPSTK